MAAVMGSMSCKILSRIVVVVVQISKFSTIKQEACEGGSIFFLSYLSLTKIFASDM